MDTVQYSDESLYGNKYFFTIMDDYSRYGWVFCVKSKTDIFPTFLKWYNTIKNIFNKNIKYIKSDRGTEFYNYQFDDFCTKNGIIQLSSIPKNPQQNGKAERFQQTLIHASRALLRDARLNYRFWEDAIKTANYIHNRLPHRGINNKIPYEILYENEIKKVDYNKLKVFGCQVFFYALKQYRKKFENSTHPGIFIGYDINPTAFRIYDKINNKVILTKAVEFFEDVPGCTKATSSIPEIEDLTNDNENDNNRIDFHSYSYRDNNDNYNNNNNNNSNGDNDNDDNNNNNDNNTNNNNYDDHNNNKVVKVPFEVPSNDISNDNNNNNFNYYNMYPNNLYQNFNSNKLIYD